MTSPRSLSIQTVLYRNGLPELVRAIEASSHSAQNAQAGGYLSEWEIALGDCSPEPALDAATRRTLAAKVSKAGGFLRYEYFGENLGHGGGHNRIAPGGSSELILVLNPDAVIGADAISELIVGMRPGVGAADGRQIPIDHPKEYDSGTGETSWASGACLMTPRAAFESVAGFDAKSFFMYCDDVDYSWRVRLQGLRVIHVPSARVFHDKRLTPTGGIEAGEAERYFSAEAAVLLAHKYSRPRLVRQIIAAFRKDPGDIPQRVIAEFERRSTAGELPERIDRAHHVGQFVKGNYAVHRF